MWLCLIPMKLKKYICAVFPGMLAVGCKHRKPHRDQHSLMNTNCFKPSFTQTRRKHLWQLKGIMRVVSFSFSLIVLFGCSKVKITQCAMRDLDPLDAARQDWTSATVRCPEQVFHSPSQIPRPRFPLHPALADSQPASISKDHWQYQEEKYAPSGSSVRKSVAIPSVPQDFQKSSLKFCENMVYRAVQGQVH